MRFASFLARLALCAGLLHAGTATAQQEVTKLVVGFPPGQSVDVIARLLAPRLATALGRSVIVENIAGQAGSAALTAVARMPADGSVLTLSASAALAGNPVLYGNVRYNSLKDFEPIGLIYDAPLVLMVHAALPIRSVNELVAYVRAHPGKVNYSSSGNGSVSHLAMSELLRRAGVQVTHVPYPGAARSLTDLAGGNVQVSFDTVGAAQPFLDAGRVRAIAISSSERVPALPNVPTIIESGIEDFNLVPWVGMLAPAGTPKAVIDKVSDELAKIVQTPEFTQRIVGLGARPRTATATEFKAFLSGEVTRWANVIKASGAKLD